MKHKPLNFIKQFFKRFPSDSELKNELNSKLTELDTAWDFLKKEAFEKAIQEAKNHFKNPNTKVVLESKRVIGFSLFKQNRYAESELIFQEISEQSEGPDDWFHLANSAALNKNIELSEKAFNKAIEAYSLNGTQESLSIPNMHYYYMQTLQDVREFEKAFSHFKKIKEFYCELVITDSHFLLIRGMPFFEDFVESSKLILENIASEKIKEQLTELKSKVDEPGKITVLELENAIKNMS